MKRIAAIVLVGLLAVCLVQPASAAKKPVPTTMYLHGTVPFGEAESIPVVADAYLKMDGQEPAAGQPKSKLITNYVVGPNATCGGNNLFPVWIGVMSGRVKGDMTFTFSSAGTPGPVEIRVWPDLVGQACDSAATGTFEYVEPSGAVTVDLPAGPGTVEAVIKKVNFTAVSSIMVQVSPVILLDIPDPGGYALNPFVSRILYDSPDYPSSLSFNCIPTTGKTCLK
jgi:hypothetical protein